MILDYQSEEKLREKAEPKSEQHRLAAVTAVSGNTMRLLFDGEDTASEKYYRGITVCSVGDRVLCARVSGTWVVLGALQS